MSYFSLRLGTLEFFETAIIFTVIKTAAHTFAENSDNNNDS